MLNWRDITDLLWPSAPGDDPAERSKLTKLCDDEKKAIDDLKGDEKALRHALESSLALYKAERERSSSVDARLSSVLSLASVATALILAVVTFLTRNESSGPTFTPQSVTIVSILGAYVSLQFLNALRAAVRGLRRRSARQDHFLSLVPESKEAHESYLPRILKGQADTRRDLTENLSDKVTCMEVAHRALMNATGAMVLAVLVLFCVTVHRAWTGRKATGIEQDVAAARRG